MRRSSTIHLIISTPADKDASIVRHTGGGFGVDGEGMLTFDRAIREAHTRVVATHA
jgi:hypothetical protein